MGRPPPPWGNPTIHNRSEVQAVGTTLEVQTVSAPWNYAVSWPLGPRTFGQPPNALRFVVEALVEVQTGALGIGIIKPDRTTFLLEEMVWPTSGPTRIRLAVDATAEVSAIVVRNVSTEGASRGKITLLSAGFTTSYSLSDMAAIPRTDYESETIPNREEVFDLSHSLRINEARLQHLASLKLPLAGKRVLDAGCGVGHHTDFYRKLGCAVVGVDGRAENITEMGKLYPHVEGHAIDVQRESLEALGSFDVVHCYGLLYHLENPVGALRHLSQICRGLLLIETMICDSLKPLALLKAETKSFDQALQGIGCRPSPAFIALTLNRLGFPHLYGAATAPDHPDFQFEWKNNVDAQRDGVDMRSIFVASRTPLELDTLIRLV